MLISNSLCFFILLFFLQFFKCIILTTLENMAPNRNQPHIPLYLKQQGIMCRCSVIARNIGHIASNLDPWNITVNVGIGPVKTACIAKREGACRHGYYFQLFPDVGEVTVGETTRRRNDRLPIWAKMYDQNKWNMQNRTKHKSTVIWTFSTETKLFYSIHTEQTTR